MTSLNQSQDIDIDVPNVDVPYYAIKLTAEQTKEVEHCLMEFYSVNGKTLFEVKGPNGKSTGEYVFYVVFGRESKEENR